MEAEGTPMSEIEEAPINEEPGWNKGWNRWLSYISFTVVCIAFLKDAWTEGKMNPWAYLAFPAGALGCYSPVMAAKLTWAGVRLIEAFTKLKKFVTAPSVRTDTQTSPEGITRTSTVTTPTGNAVAGTVKVPTDVGEGGGL